MTDDKLKAAGEAALAEAVRFWESDIYDPLASDKSEHANFSRSQIDEMFKRCGWLWEVPYKGDRNGAEWCGIFVGACWYKAGIDPSWLLAYFASTYRLDLYAHYCAFDVRRPNPRPSVGIQRQVAMLDPNSTALPFEPRAGDILTIGDGNPPAGDHICLIESFDPASRAFQTIEGNGNGVGPDGKRRQGVVRGTRHLGGTGYCARRVIRPAPHDLLP